MERGDECYVFLGRRSDSDFVQVSLSRSQGSHHGIEKRAAAYTCRVIGRSINYRRLQYLGVTIVRGRAMIPVRISFVLVRFPITAPLSCRAC
jgi:hypothetical protein